MQDDKKPTSEASLNRQSPGEGRPIGLTGNRAEAAHTPGPWRTGRADMQSYRASDGVPEVFVYRGEEERIPVYGENCWPDARLIAAAPEMLEALRAWERWWSEDCMDDAGPIRLLGLAALAKAEGRES